MNMYYYQADSLADAFEMASRDTKKWNFPAMEALAEIAVGVRRDLLQGNKPRTSRIYSGSLGQFIVIVDSKKGYGFGLLSLTGREAGIEDPTAAEILEFHRDRPEEELFAEPLVIFSEHVQDIYALDAGYELLTQAGFLVRTDSIVELTVGDETILRPQYRLHRRDQDSLLRRRIAGFRP